MMSMHIFFGLIFFNFSLAYKVSLLKADVECPPWTGEIFFLPDPADCGKYYVCDASGPVHMNCPAGLWWNKLKNECDWPYNTDCGCKFDQLFINSKYAGKIHEIITTIFHN